MIDLAIFSIGSPVMPEATNRLMATGGVIMPMAIPTTNTIPKCTRLIFIALTKGKNTGVKIMMAEDVSINTPAIRMIMAIRNIIIYGLLDTLRTEFAMASGIFQFASTHPKGPLHAIIIIITAEVLALPFMMLNNSFGPISR